MDVPTRKVGTFLLPFFPKEFAKDGIVANKEIVKESEQAKRVGDLRLYSEGKLKYLPDFGNDDFDREPALIKKALSRPGTILKEYETLKASNDPEKNNLQQNPDFLRVMQDILAREYPDFFGKTEGTKWYSESGPHFHKITTLLDIIKYRPPERQQHFMDMMNDAERADTRGRAIDRYMEAFAGTETGLNITFWFEESGLVHSLKDNTMKMLESKKDALGGEKSNIYRIIHTNPTGELLYKRSFPSIPQHTLDTLLGHLLPRIERLCPNGNQEEIAKMLDTIAIDPVYKVQFFTGILSLASLGDPNHVDADIKFYAEIVKRCGERINVSSEKKTLSGQEKEYSVITRAF